MRVMMIGATGLVGSLLADRLLAGGAEVHAFVRRTSGREHPRWTEHVAAAEHWPDAVARLRGDKAVSALGTTWRAAGSEAAFRAVDLDMVVSFARAAQAAGARHMLTVSAIGADAGSRNFYLRTKGETEQSLEAMGFRRLDVMRPGLLRGVRGGERRLVERLGIALSPVTNLFLRGRLSCFAAIDADVVAGAAAACLLREEAGVYRHDNAALLRLALGWP